MWICFGFVLPPNTFPKSPKYPPQVPLQMGVIFGVVFVFVLGFLKVSVVKFAQEGVKTGVGGPVGSVCTRFGIPWSIVPAFN